MAKKFLYLTAALSSGLILASSKLGLAAVWYASLFSYDSEVVTACKTMRMIGIDNAGVEHKASEPLMSSCLKILKDLNLRLYHASIENPVTTLPSGAAGISADAVVKLSAKACRRLYKSGKTDGHPVAEITCFWTELKSARAEALMHDILIEHRLVERSGVPQEDAFKGLPETINLPADGSRFVSTDLDTLWKSWLNGGMKCHKYQIFKYRPLTWNCYFDGKWLHASKGGTNDGLGQLRINIGPTDEQDLRVEHQGTLRVGVWY